MGILRSGVKSDEEKSEESESDELTYCVRGAKGGLSPWEDREGGETRVSVREPPSEKIGEVGERVEAEYEVSIPPVHPSESDDMVPLVNRGTPRLGRRPLFLLLVVPRTRASSASARQKLGRSLEGRPIGHDPG